MLGRFDEPAGLQIVVTSALVAGLQQSPWPSYVQSQIDKYVHYETALCALEDKRATATTVTEFLDRSNPLPAAQNAATPTYLAIVNLLGI